MAGNTISLLYFAKLADDLGVTNEQYSISEKLSLGELKLQLSQRGEQWQDLKAAHIKCALNQTLCDDNTLVKFGDEVAFFPPVTGG